MAAPRCLQPSGSVSPTISFCERASGLMWGRLVVLTSVTLVISSSPCCLSDCHFHGSSSCALQTLPPPSDHFYRSMSILGDSVGKNPLANVGDMGSIPGSGRFPGEGNGNPLQYSCLENPMDRGDWWAKVHDVSKESDMT